MAKNSPEVAKLCDLFLDSTGDESYIERDQYLNYWREKLDYTLADLEVEGHFDMLEGHKDVLMIMAEHRFDSVCFRPSVPKNVVKLELVK